MTRKSFFTTALSLLGLTALAPRAEAKPATAGSAPNTNPVTRNPQPEPAEVPMELRLPQLSTVEPAIWFVPEPVFVGVDYGHKDSEPAVTIFRSVRCPDCVGAGRINIEFYGEPDSLGRRLMKADECRTCRGAGRVNKAEPLMCHLCKGDSHPIIAQLKDGADSFAAFCSTCGCFLADL